MSKPFDVFRLLFTPLIVLIGLGAINFKGAAQERLADLLARSQTAISQNQNGFRAVQLSGLRRDGFNGVTGELLKAQPYDLKVLFPDHFIEVETTPFYTARTGFAGITPIWIYSPRNGSQLRPTSSVVAGNERKLRVSRLILGMFLRLNGPVTQSAQGVVSRPDRISFDFKGSDGSRSVVDVDPNSMVPVRVRYDSLERFPRPLSTDERKAGLVHAPSPPEKVESTIDFARRESTDGVFVPLLIRRVARGVVFEEIQVETVVIDPPLTRKDFAPSAGQF